MTRMVTDLNALRNWISVGVARMSVACVSLLGVLATLAWFDPLAAAVVAGVVAVCCLVAAALTPTLRARVREARRLRGSLAGNLGEKVFAFATVRHHGRVARESRRMLRQSRRMTDALVRRMRAAGLLRALPDAAFPLAAAGLVLVLGTRSAAGDGAPLVVTLLLLGMMMASLRDLLQAWDYRLSFEEGRRRIEQLLAAPRVREAREPGALEGEGPVGVTFLRVGVKGLLRRVLVRADAGDRVVVTGPAASGKSTLLALLCRLFDPDSGEIQLDRAPLAKLALEVLESDVRLVSPELPLLRGTVRANLDYGADTADPEAVARAARVCRLDVAGPGLPEGLDSEVREKGANLSASLRSRVALARALAARPRLLLIDDPVFFVDGEARAALDDALALAGATVVVVAPSARALSGADRIWRVERGRVREVRPPAARGAAGGVSPVPAPG
jgi:ABC-type multidrug transport system fused ATPase/permease subunit